MPSFFIGAVTALFNQSVKSFLPVKKYSHSY